MKKNDVLLGLAAISLLVTGCGTAESDSYYEMNLSVPMYDALYNGSNTNNVPSTSQGDKFEGYTDNPFVKTAQQSVSTFSVDADGASYAIVRRYLENGFNVDPSSVRIEEFLNYFTFNYNSPSNGENVAINAEVGDCPWNTEHKLLRLGIKGKELTASEMPRANFVFLIDVSGSMASSDKLFLLKSGLKQLLYQLNPDDRISIVTYSGSVEKLLESTPVKEARKIERVIDMLSASGCTAGGEALKIAYEEALTNYDPKCNNRVIMGTDGDFNVGVTNTEALVEMVESYASKGIYMTCLGFGYGNLNDAMMEKISNAGNGTYHYIDSEDEMTKVFVHERSHFVSVANDAKCQITFDEKLVSEYRLIGYENRVMEAKDFEDDKKDAGEIGAGQTITALYEIVPNISTNTSLSSPFVTFDFRYKNTLQSESRPLQLKLTADLMLNKNERSDEFYFAAGIAVYGMLLRESPYKGNATTKMAINLVSRGLSYDPHNYRAELLSMIGKTEELKK